MRRECRESFSPPPFQRKPLVSDRGMHHGTCVTHVPWCMSGSLTCGDGENVPGIPRACAPAILRVWQEAHWQEPVGTPWWCHDIETFSTYYWILWGKSADDQWIPLTKDQQCCTLIYALLLALTLTSCWPNSRIASTLRHHDPHLTSPNENYFSITVTS